jgi:hypothetical protein
LEFEALYYSETEYRLSQAIMSTLLTQPNSLAAFLKVLSSKLDMNAEDFMSYLMQLSYFKGFLERYPPLAQEAENEFQTTLSELGLPKLIA